MDKKKILQIGSYPLKFNHAQQFDVKECDMLYRQMDLCVYDEIIIMSDYYNEKPVDADLVTIAKLGTLKDGIKSNRQKVFCHLLLRSQSALSFLRKTDLCSVVKLKIDIYPFTIEEIWGRSIVLDYEPITIHSNKHVHLVIFGMGELAETVAIQVAHRVHYLNYEKIHATPRIAMIS